MLNEGKHRNVAGMRDIIKLAFSMNNKGKYRKIKEKELVTFLESSETIRQNPI